MHVTYIHACRQTHKIKMNTYFKRALKQNKLGLIGHPSNPRAHKPRQKNLESKASLDLTILYLKKQGLGMQFSVIEYLPSMGKTLIPHLQTKQRLQQTDTCLDNQKEATQFLQRRSTKGQQALKKILKLGQCDGFHG